MFGLFDLALGTGARLGEMLALTWKDVNFEAGTVTFQRTLSDVDSKLTVKDVKTANGRRTVILPQFAIEALHEQRKNNVLERLAACPWSFRPSGAPINAARTSTAATSNRPGRQPASRRSSFMPYAIRPPLGCFRLEPHPRT